MLSKLKKNNKGFTIIEVLIVLAIAGLILLIVFLAVPALQRNSRNNQRNSDASKIGAAVSDCLGNKNGQIGSCDSLAEVQAVGLDTTKIQQLSTIVITAGAPAAPAAGVLNTINVGWIAKCNPAGDAVITGTARQAAAVYRVEDTGSAGVVRCIDI